MSTAKNLLGATAVITLAGVISRLLAIVSAPILTSLLGPEPYGVIALLGTYIALGATLATLGIDFSYNRYACSGRLDEDNKVEIFCWRFVLGTSSIVTIIFVGADLFGAHNLLDIQQGQITIAGISIFLAVLGIMAQTRSRMAGAYRKLAVTLILTAAISTVVNILLAKYWRRDAWPLLLGNLSGFAITLAILGMPNMRKLFVHSQLSAEKRRELLAFGLMGSAISAPLYWVISSSDRWFLSGYLNNTSLGIYSFSYNIAIIGQMLNSAFLVAWRTESTKVYENDAQNAPHTIGQLWGRFAVLLSLAWLAVTSSGGDIIRLLADRRFHEGTLIIPWISGAVFFYGLSHLASTGLLLKKNMKPFTYWYVVSAIVSIALNFVLVPQLGLLGAALVQAISFAIAAIGIMWHAQAMYPLTIDFRMLARALLLVLVAGITMSIPWHSQPLLSLCYKLPVGLLVSATILYYVAPDWFMRGQKIAADFIAKRIYSTDSTK